MNMTDQPSEIEAELRWIVNYFQGGIRPTDCNEWWRRTCAALAAAPAAPPSALTADLRELLIECKRQLNCAVDYKESLALSERIETVLSAPPADIAALASAREALEAMDEFAWSAVSCDCQESHDGLAARLVKVRAALAALDAGVKK